MTTAAPQSANPPAKPPKKRKTLRIGNGQIVISWKFGVALVLAAIIVFIGFATNEKDPWAGALVAFSTVIGALLGAALQFQPVERDFSPSAQGAIRGLNMIAQNTVDTIAVVEQVATSTKETRTSAGLMSVQTSMGQIVSELQVSMVQWDSVAPGSLAAFEAERLKGSALLKRLSAKEES